MKVWAKGLPPTYYNIPEDDLPDSIQFFLLRGYQFEELDDTKI